MTGTPPRHLALYVLAALAVLAFGARQVLESRAAQQPVSAGAPGGIALEPAAGEGGGRVVVHVAGAVRRPGVYRLRVGARVTDAVDRAGGARRRADLAQLNLAAELEDGRQVVVPVRTPVGAAGSASAAVAGAAAPAPGLPVNLNTATMEQLDALPGVGPATAQRILDYREANGGFGSVEELGQVPGIGEVRLASLREQVRV